MTQYVYRTDALSSLRAQAHDPWLRARRVRAQPPSYPHWQIGDALAGVGPGAGVFSLSMFRALDRPLSYLQHEAALLRALGPHWNRISMLQRIRADHPFFQRYRRGDDQYLSGEAWLYWNTTSCLDTQDWSGDGIAHADIEVFHPDGYWATFEEVLSLAADSPAPGFIRCPLPAAYQGDAARHLDARWVDHPSLGPCVFARVPASSPAVWPTNVADRRVLGTALFGAFPELVEAGRLVVVLERATYSIAFDVAVVRNEAVSASRLDRWLRGATDRPASASLHDAEAIETDDAVEGLYAAAGMDKAALGAAAFACGPDALAILEKELTTAPASMVGG